MMRPDLEVTRLGTFTMIAGMTPAGNSWLGSCASEPWQWIGAALACDPTCADAFLELAAEDGLEVSQ